MKRVITYGTFDLLHYGHINLFKRAKALGDYLIVAISTDEFNWKEKQKNSAFFLNRVITQQLYCVDFIRLTHYDPLYRKRYSNAIVLQAWRNGPHDKHATRFSGRGRKR